jgi:hypothetical protein
VQHLTRDGHAPDFKACFLGRIKQKDLAWHDDLLEIKVPATNAFKDQHATGVVLVNALNHDVFTRGQPIWALENKVSVRLITKKLGFRFCLDELALRVDFGIDSYSLRILSDDLMLLFVEKAFSFSCERFQGFRSFERSSVFS